MTRIIAGTVGGRRIETPRGEATRPTTDRVREALFSRLGSLLDLEGTRVLDLYAGSGALGLEALSRGAAALCAVESDRGTARLLTRNARTLGLADRVTVLTDRVERVLDRGPGGAAYDLALLDPPYPLGQAAVEQVLLSLTDRGWLAGAALVVVERSTRSPAPGWPARLRPLEARRYGETTVHLAELDPGRAGA